MFEIGYDSHPLTSESNMTPAQFWLYGMANYVGEGGPPEEDMSSFGIEYDGDTWNDFSVQVPEIPFPLSDTVFNKMKCAVAPLEESSCYGIDIYIKSLEIFSLIFF